MRSTSPYRVAPRRPDARAGSPRVVHLSLRWIRAWCADDEGVYVNVKHEIAFVDGQTCARRVMATFPRDAPGAFDALLADETHVYTVRQSVGRPPSLCRIEKHGGEEEVVAELAGDFSSVHTRVALHGDHVYARTPSYAVEPKGVGQPAMDRLIRVPCRGGAVEALSALPEPVHRVFTTGSPAARPRPLPSGRARVYWSADLRRRGLGVQVTGRSRWLRPRASLELVEAPGYDGPLGVLGAWEIDRDVLAAVDADEDGAYAITRRARWLRASIDDLVWFPVRGGDPELLCSWTTERKRRPWIEVRSAEGHVYWRIDRQLMRIEKRAAGP